MSSLENQMFLVTASVRCVLIFSDILNRDRP